MPTENQDFVFCKSYRHKSGKIIVHPTGYFKFPRTRPLKEEKGAIRNKKSDDPDNSNSIS